MGDGSTTGSFDRLDEKKRIVRVKQFKSLVTAFAFMAMGICRTVQGPSMIDLQEQTNLMAKDFQLVFLLCTISFPLGNLIAGFLIDRYEGQLFMAAVTSCMGAFFISIPFTTSLASLCVVATASEFFMGMVDTGANINILKLWSDNDNNSGVYFSSLHFLFGIGNLLGPLMAEAFLQDAVEVDQDVTENDNDKQIQLDMDQTTTTSDAWKSLLKSAQLTDLQMLHTILTLFIFVTGVLFVVSMLLQDGSSLNIDGNGDCFEVISSKEEIALQEDVAMEDFCLGSAKVLDSRHHYRLRLAFLSCMTLLFCVANGINFAFSNFITLFAVRSQLALTKSVGARTTAIYFGCSALMKFSSIWLLKLMKPFHLMVFNLVILAGSSISLMVFGETHLIVFQVGSALAGIGISTLFSTGVVWAQQKTQVGSQVTSVFLIATSIGAQVLKIPVAKWIEVYPMTLMMVLSFSAVFIILAFISAKIITKMARMSSASLPVGDYTAPTSL